MGRTLLTMAIVAGTAAWLRAVPADPVAGFLAGMIIGLGSVMATTSVIAVTWRR